MSSNLFRRDQNIGWFPSADAMNAPKGALLRADNVIHDELGIVALRRGTQINYGPMVDLDVHSLHAAVLDDTQVVAAGVGDKVYANGVDLGATFDGTGDIRFGEDFEEIFMARGTTRKKYDGTNLYNWGIAKPVTVPTVTAIDAVAKTFATCASGEAPGFTANEGSKAHVNGYDGTANAAMELTPAASGRVTVTKTFATDEDFFNINGRKGEDTDLFDMIVSLDDPDSYKSIEVMIGLAGVSGDPFQTDYYSFQFKKQHIVKTRTAVERQIERKAQKKSLTPQKGGKKLSGSKLTDWAKAQVKQRDTEVSENRADMAGPAWFHLTIPRGDFKRIGNTPTADWKKVKAIKITFKVAKGAGDKARFDEIKMFGGGESAFNGTYKVIFRPVRDNGTYISKGVPSDESAEIVVKQQGLRVTISAAELAVLDPQVTGFWIYITGGYLDTWYRVAATGVSPTDPMNKIDEFTPADGVFTMNDLTIMAAFGLGIPGSSVATDLIIDITSNEIDALLEQEVLETGPSLPPNDIVDIEGPWNDRTWVLAEDGFLYPSQINDPTCFSVLQAVPITGVPRWIKQTTGGLYVGTSDDVFRVSGTAGDLPDGTIDVRIDKTNIGFPPVDDAVAAEGNFIIYRASDGWRIFGGVSSTPVPREAVDLLWRGQDRHGVARINTDTGRFKAAITHGIASFLTPEGGDETSSAVLHRYDLTRQKWYRHVYPFSIRSLHRSTTGELLAGDTAGNIQELDSGTLDNGNTIDVEIWSPVDDDGLPLNRKVPFDITIAGELDLTNLTVDVLLDNTSNSNLYVRPGWGGFSTDKFTINTLPKFRSAQLRFTGSFGIFRLNLFSLAYRPLPQMRRTIDTGYITIPGGADRGSIREIRLHAIAGTDILVKLFFEDVQYGPEKTMTTIAGLADVYTMRWNRDAWGRKPRLLFSSGVDGVAEDGIEPYSLEIRMRPSGNVTEKPIIQKFFAAGERT